MDEKLRNTGRTTRMLDFAIESSLAGKRVFVMMDSERSIDRASRYVQSTRDLRKPLPTPIEYASSAYPFFDWDTFTVRGTCYDVILIDHYVIERKFATALGYLHKWDVPVVLMTQNVNLVYRNRYNLKLVAERISGKRDMYQVYENSVPQFKWPSDRIENNDDWIPAY